MIDEIKQQVLVASRVLYAPNGVTGVQEGFSGHVSHRLPAGGRYVVAGHTHVVGRSTLDVGYDDLVTVDMGTGERLESEEDGDALGKALGDSFALLMPGHGVVVAADTIEQALVSTVYLEGQAKNLYHASLLGEISESYLRLNTSPPRATRDGDSMQW